MSELTLPLVGLKLTKEQNAMVLKAKKALMATGDPTSIIVAKNLRGGLQVVTYLFEEQIRAEKNMPKGFELEPLTLQPKTLAATGACVAAQWLIVAVLEALNRKEGLTVIKKNGKREQRHGTRSK